MAEPKNNKKISIWQDIKNEINIVWKTKKKWIIATYLLLATFFASVDFIKGWKLLSLWEYFVLFPFIFLSFCIPRILKQYRQTNKKLADIVKKAKVNEPKKYRKANLIFKIFFPFFLLNIITLLWLCYTIPEDNLVGKAQVFLLIISLFVISFLLHLSFVLYCHEISKPREEPQKTGAEPL